MVVRGDLFDHEALLRGMRGCGTVFHVAGANAMCARDPWPMLRVNVEGAAAVVRAAAAARVSRVVHTSSATTIGERTGRIGREDTLHRGTFLSNYERSKVLGERRVLSLGERLGVPVVSVNPSSVQGPGRTGGSALLLLDIVNGRPARAREHLALGGRHRRLHRRPPARRARWAPGNRYLVSGASFDRAHGSDAPPGSPAVRAAPGSHPRTGSVGGPVAGAMARLRREIRICHEMVRTLLHGHRFDASLAERELGLRYTPIEVTIRRALAWYADRPPRLAPPPIG